MAPLGTAARKTLLHESFPMALRLCARLPGKLREPSWLIDQASKRKTATNCTTGRASTSEIEALTAPINANTGKPAIRRHSIDVDGPRESKRNLCMITPSFTESAGTTATKHFTFPAGVKAASAVGCVACVTPRPKKRPATRCCRCRSSVDAPKLHFWTTVRHAPLPG